MLQQMLDSSSHEPYCCQGLFRVKPSICAASMKEQSMDIGMEWANLPESQDEPATGSR